jgi:hypothetical protein
MFTRSLILLGTLGSSVVFLATPHTGSRLANYIEALGAILRTTVSTQELAANAPALRDLNLWYRNNAKALGTDTLVFFETQDTKGVRVVDETSADPGIEGVVPRAVDADHLSISKPSPPEDLLPKRVLAFVKACLRRSKGKKAPTPQGLKEQALLRALYSALALKGSAELDAEDVNTLAQPLCLSPEETFTLVEQLRAEELVTAHSGGRVSLTPEGRDRAEGKVTHVPEVHLEAGATYIGPSAHILGSAIGPHAMGAGAVRIEIGAGDLAAALQALRVNQSQLVDPEAQKVARELGDTLEAVLQEITQRPPDKKTLRQRFGEATELVEKLGKWEDACNKLGPILASIGKVLGLSL